MQLSIILNFYNMRREADRTLYSLTREYQQGVADFDYEVICLDHGSSTPLDTSNDVFKQPNFHYSYIQTKSPSPCKALNNAVQNCDGDYVMVCIDGARVFSPGLIAKSMQAAQFFNNPFVFTLNAHLGSEPQFKAIAKGYNQQLEDQLLSESSWQQDGYELFNIACLGGSAMQALDALPAESNTPLLKRQVYLERGGYNPKFVSPGGGLSNLEFFKRMVEHPSITPVLIVGEASFHQFHGGTITGATGETRVNRFAEMRREYEHIIGTPYARSSARMQLYGTGSAAWNNLLSSPR